LQPLQIGLFDQLSLFDLMSHFCFPASFDERNGDDNFAASTEFFFHEQNHK
jgi:hypothetical protein